MIANRSTSDILLLAEGRFPDVSAVERDLALLGRRVWRAGAWAVVERGMEFGGTADVVVALSSSMPVPISLTIERLRRAPGVDVCVVALVPPGSEPALVCGVVDDFVIQPANAGEICLRLAVARERHNRTGAQPQTPPPPLTLDENAFDVRVGGSSVDLTYTEFELLRALYDRRGTVVSREALARAVWGNDQLNGSRAIDVHMWRLRTKLEASGGRLIETVRNRGYRLL